MSKRRRWRNVKGTASRVTEPRERLAVGLASLGALALKPFLGRPAADSPADVLVLRLDRIGDVLMTLPALHALRAALPSSRIRLAVGRWSREVAMEAPVDEVLEWNAPWVGRRDEGASSMSGLLASARAMQSRPPDLAIDLQGDVRAIWLMAATGARARASYANRGSAALLTTVIELDENLNFVEQNYRAIETAIGRSVPRTPFRWLDHDRRARGKARLRELLTAAGRNPETRLLGIHPGAGRAIKEWPVDRFIEVARVVARERNATIVVTGSGTEAEKTAAIKAGLPDRALDLGGRLDLRELAEIIGACDVFVSGDTAAMHFACAIGTPSVAIFGPSDPGRYFSGGHHGFNSGASHVVLAPDIWCGPCNLIRRPPDECAEAPVPDCLAMVSVARVAEAVLSLLSRPAAAISG
jgi:heptosyltransferase I